MRWALNQLALSREQEIDEAVVDRTAARREYASALLMFADGAAAPLAPALPFGSQRQVAERIRNLCVRTVGTRRQIRRRVALLASLVILMSAGAACAMPFQRSGTGAPVRVAGAIEPPRVVRQVRPTYSPEAMQAKAQGDVTLDVVIAKDGSVRDARVVKSIPVLDQSAIDAARQWMFEPVRVRGRPVDALVTLEFRFTLK
jgi:TonB family protein